MVALGLLLIANFAAGALPADAFTGVYGPPDIAAAALSPDGRHIAYVARDNGTMRGMVLDIDAAKITQRFELTQDAFTARLSATVRWLSPTRFLIHYSRDIVALDTDGRNVTRLVDWSKPEWTKPSMSSSGTPLPTRRLVRIVALPPGEPDFAYVEGVGRPSSVTTDVEDHALFKVHLATGALQTVAKEELSGTILYDQQGRPRIWRSPAKPPLYRYRPADAPRAKWQPLDQTIAAPDGQRLTFGVKDFFGQRSIPLGFDYDPNLLYLASNLERDTYGIYAIDLRTGRRTALALEDPLFDFGNPLATGREATLVFDHARQQLAGVRLLGLGLKTRWLDPELASVQTKIDAVAPMESVVIEQWDSARERFLVQLSSRGDPGAYAIYFRGEDKLRTILPRSKPRATTARTTPWAFKHADGAILTGYLTLPAAPKRKPVPIVVCTTSEWGRVPAHDGTEVAALAHMGFAVLEVNHRGVVGLGLKHWLAGRQNFDGVAAEDVFLAIDRVAQAAGLEPGKVALLGFGFGGTVALRIAQLQPERVGCIVALHPTLDLVNWTDYNSTFGDNKRLHDEARRWFFGESAKDRREHSPLHQADKLHRPVLLAASEIRGFRPDDTLAAFRSKLKRAGNEAEFIPITRGFEDPGRYNAAFVAIEQFLGKHLLKNE